MSDRSRSKPARKSVANVLWAFLGATVGASIVLIAQRGYFSLLPEHTSFVDLAAILLTAVGVIVAVFGGVLALLALWGFRQIKTDAINAAADSGTAEVREQIENGPLRDYIGSEIDQIIGDYMKSDEFDAKLRERIDEAALGSREDRELDPDGEDDV